MTTRTLTITFSSALHHGSGFGRGGLGIFIEKGPFSTRLQTSDMGANRPCSRLVLTAPARIRNPTVTAKISMAIFNQPGPQRYWTSPLIRSSRYPPSPRST